MPLIGMFAAVLVVVGIMLAVTVALCIDRSILVGLKSDFSNRFLLLLPSLVLLGGILLLNSILRQFTNQISWILGINISGIIFQIEGTLVGEFQRLSSPEMTAYLSFVYIFGYILLLVFPLIAYFAAEKMQTLHEVTIAYTANYTIGLLCYLLFIAYGPRNLAVAQPLMYDVYPQIIFLTFSINLNTNVFPSLHTSLAVTVILFAWRTKSIYPRWFWIATIIGMSVIVSTMYLGIHWIIDVIAGFLLGYASYRLGIHWADRWIEIQAARPALSPLLRHRF